MEMPSSSCQDAVEGVAGHEDLRPLLGEIGKKPPRFRVILLVGDMGGWVQPSDHGVG